MTEDWAGQMRARRELIEQVEGMLHLELEEIRKASDQEILAASDELFGDVEV